MGKRAQKDGGEQGLRAQTLPAEDERLGSRGGVGWLGVVGNIHQTETHFLERVLGVCECS